MTATQAAPLPGVLEPLGDGVAAHLQAQLDSARRLLEIVLRQGGAIRRRDVEAIVGTLAELQAEAGRRSRLEGDRSRLLAVASRALGTEPHELTLDDITAAMTPTSAQRAQALSAELQGLLAELAREHSANRAVMRQELSFLDHLLRLMGGDPQGGYGRSGPVLTQDSPGRYVVDARA